MTNTVQTVTGPRRPSELGLTLMHEHLVIGWPGWESDTAVPPSDKRETKRICVERMLELKSLGVIFFASFFLAALSFLTAPVIARRIGVVKTMAFSHGLASLIYLVLPLAPSLGPAAALLIIRSFFAYMDNPLRASFTMAMVQSSERGSAAGVTSLARIVPFGVSPTISTYLMQTISLTLPLFIGGGLQLINDIAFYLMFRRMRPPEEIPLAAKLGREG